MSESPGAQSVAPSDQSPQTIGGWTSVTLAEQAASVVLGRFTNDDAIELGLILLNRARADELPVVIEVRHLGRVAFRAAMPGTSADNDSWIARKSATAERFGRASLAERVGRQERGAAVDEQPHLPAERFAAHGGAVPIEVAAVGVVGLAIVSGLPQLEDHELVVWGLRRLREQRP